MSMAYRLYALDKEGHFAYKHLLPSATDGEARAAARSYLRPGMTFELWDDNRLIVRYLPDPTADDT
jgi:hypothetical protein